MRWSRTIQTVDVHCAGEVGRVITSGVLDIPGASMADKLVYLNTEDDSLRRWLCSEPRSAPAGSFCLLLPTRDPSADVGFIVLQPDQAHAMSGSNAMCAVTAMLETGLKPMSEPETTVTLDTAAGLVRAVARCEDGKVTKVSLDMPPSFVAVKDGVVHSEKWGDVRYDLCFGGVFYALVDVEQLGMTIEPEHARELAMNGVELRELISTLEPAIYPDIPALSGLAYVMFRQFDTDGVIRTCTTLRPGRADRSPCGTGSNANMAVQQFEGKVKPGDSLVSRSIIGGEFTTEYIATTQVGPYTATQNRISGQCWIYGMSTIGLDPSDPFPLGFRLSDTWGS